MAKRVKATVIGITKQQFDEALVEYARLDADITKINADTDVKINEIKSGVSGELSYMIAQRDNHFNTLKDYAVENKDTLFQKKKSINTAYGTLGFRTSTPKLKTLKGFTWQSVTNLLKEFLPKYVRIVEEPAKDVLLASRDNNEITKYFPKVGIEVVKDESFYIDLKKEN